MMGPFRLAMLHRMPLIGKARLSTAQTRAATQHHAGYPQPPRSWGLGVSGLLVSVRLRVLRFGFVNVGFGPERTPAQPYMLLAQGFVAKDRQIDDRPFGRTYTNNPKP